LETRAPTMVSAIPLLSTQPVMVVAVLRSAVCFSQVTESRVLP